MPFGKPAALGVIEISIFKYIWQRANDNEIRAILDLFRFTDNVVAWGKTQPDLEERGKELENIFSEYYPLFKHSTEPWRQMEEGDARRTTESENIYRLTSDLEHDTKPTVMELTIHQKSRGMKVKPNLFEELTTVDQISRKSLSILLATIVAVDGVLSAPLQLEAKALLSRSAQVCGSDKSLWKTPLAQFDPQLAEDIMAYLR